MQIVSSHYYSAWWEASLPPNWYGYSDDGVATFRSDDDIGALHISEALKDEPVNDEDLREFAGDRIGGRACLVSIQLGEFDGINAEYIDDDGIFARMVAAVSRVNDLCNLQRRCWN
jgi:hypothetical protein